MWQRHMLADIHTVFVPKEARDYIGNPEMSKVIAWLTAPDGRFGADPVAARNAFLEKTLDSALDRLTRLLGSDIDKWKLGGFHRATILHPLSSALKPELREIFDVGKLGRGGDSYTVTATGGADNQTSGGSFKIIADTEDWDNSVGLNNPGQSGDVNDPHYRDLYELWAHGKYFPVFYSRPKVESVTERVLSLKPASTSSRSAGN
jgi:penicillin amidase